jgi:hypothetical protein
MSALSVIPLALAFAWLALGYGGRVWLALAAACSALVVSNNFYGALALAWLFPILVWSLWITHRDRRIFGRAAAIAALAYGLTAWWLTPSYFRITVENLRLVAHPGNGWSRWITLAAALLFAWISARLARGRKQQAWRIFVAGTALFFLLLVAGNYYFDFRIAGEPLRFVPELDLALILLGLEVLRSLAGTGVRWKQGLAAGLVVIAFAAGHRYLAKPWSIYQADFHYQDRMEYRLAEWTAQHLPGARIYPTGSLRLWFNAWHNQEQVGGGSDQGLLNVAIAVAQWQITKDPQPGRDLLWLQAVGADAVILHERPSPEILQEYVTPRKFAGQFPVLYDDGNGDVIYRVPRRYPAHARVVDKRAVESLRRIPISNDDAAELAAYVDALEHGPDRPVEMRWESPRELRLRADVREGEAVVVQESYDPAWRASSGGRAITIRPDAAGFMLLEAPPGAQEIRLVFPVPAENIVGRAISTICALIVILFSCRWISGSGNIAPDRPANPMSQI